MKKTNESPLKFGVFPNLSNAIRTIKNNPTLAQAAGIATGTGTVNTSGMSAMAPGTGTVDKSGMSAIADPQVAAPDAPTGNMFEGQKFQITPVQMKGSFSKKSLENANGIYGSEYERQYSVSPLNKKSCGSYKK